MVKIFNAYTVVDLICDKCGKKMKTDGKVLATYPPQYSYFCGCGHTESSTTFYPYQELVYDKSEYTEDVNGGETNG